MKKISRHIRRQKYGVINFLRSSSLAKWIVVLSLLMIGLMVALPLWRLLPVVQENPYIPLHYNIYLGVDRFGPWFHVFILPALGFIFLVTNLMLAAAFAGREDSVFGKKRTEPVLSRFFLYMTPVLEFIFLVGLSLTLLLNL